MEFKSKIDSMEKDLNSWKDTNLDAITSSLENAKDNVFNNEHYSEIISMIEELKEDIATDWLYKKDNSIGEDFITGVFFPKEE